MRLKSVGSEFRRHPVVYGACSAMMASGAALLFLNAGLAWTGGGRGLPGWSIWVGLGLLALPQLWIARVRCRGPFSPRSKEQLLFWKSTRLALMIVGLTMLLRVALVIGILAYAAWRDLIPFGSTSWLISAETLEAIWELALRTGAPLLLGAGALWAGYTMRRRIRRLEGKCAQCAYSLRGLAEPRCPECGAAFNPKDYPDLSAPQPERRSE